MKPIKKGIAFKSSNAKFSQSAGDGQVEAAQQRPGQDLEAVGRGQGRHAGRRRVQPRHAPLERQARRPRPPGGTAQASDATLETRLLMGLRYRDNHFPCKWLHTGASTQS